MNGEKWIKKHKILLIEMQHYIEERKNTNNKIQTIRKELVQLDQELIQGKIRK